MRVPRDLQRLQVEIADLLQGQRVVGIRDALEVAAFCVDWLDGKLIDLNLDDRFSINVVR